MLCNFRRIFARVKDDLSFLNDSSTRNVIGIIHALIEDCLVVNYPSTYRAISKQLNFGDISTLRLEFIESMNTANNIRKHKFYWHKLLMNFNFQKLTKIFKLIISVQEKIKFNH